MNYRVRKGNRAETAVKIAFERMGLIVRDGPHTEAGCDLYVFHPDRTLYTEAEVKGRKDTTVNGLQPKEKRSMARRAAICKRLSWPYRLYFVRWNGAKLPPHAEIYTIGGLTRSSVRQGLHLDLYEEGLLNLREVLRPPPMGSEGSPSPPPLTGSIGTPSTGGRK